MALARSYPLLIGGNLSFPHGGYNPAYSMWGQAPALAALNEKQVAAEYHNEFWHFTTGECGLASVLTDTGTAAVIAGQADHYYGALQIEASDGTVADNDQAYVGSEVPTWMLHAGSDLFIEYAVRFVEANGDDANIIVGLSSIYAAETLLDDGAGPAANYDGIVFFKVDGGTVWQMETSRAAAQTALVNVGTRVSGEWTRLGFHVEGAGKVTGYIDGQAVGVITGATLPNAAMGLLMGVKNGFTNLEVLCVDRVDLLLTRA